MYFIFCTLNIFLFGQAPPKPNQKNHLDPISLLMDGSGLKNPDPDRRKNPDPSETKK